MKNILLFIFLLTGFSAISQTCQMTFTNPTFNSATNKFRTTLTITSTSGNNTWELGSMNLRFNFPTNTLSNPVIAVNFLAGSGFSYGAPTTAGSTPSSGIMSYNATLPSGQPGKPIPTSGFNIMTIEWDVINVSGLSNAANKLQWRNPATFANPKLAIVTSTQTTGCPSGCVLTYTSTPDLAPLISSGSALSVSITKTDQTSCLTPDGSATATATGGTTPYTYLWSNGATTVSISGLSAGNYSVTVTDNTAGTANASASIAAPPVISGTASSITQPTCNGGSNGSVVITASGGTAPYTIVPTQTGLVAGSYTFTITDSKGCSTTVPVTITQPAVLAATFTKTDVSCFGGNNGSVTFTTTGGTAPYSFNPSTTGLSAGNYNYTITDSKGCSITRSVTILDGFSNTVNAGPDVSVNCSNPSAILTATGGTGTFLWSTGATTASITVSPTTTTTYTVTITSTAGCTATDAVVVTSAGVSPPVANAGLDVTIAYGASATLTASGGVSYLWSNGATTASTSVSPVNRTTYTVTVTGASGCTASDDVIVVVEKKYNLSFVNPSVIGNKFRFTIRMSTNTPFCIGSNNLRFNFNKNALNNLTIVTDAFPHPAFSALTTTGTNYTSGIASINAAYNDVASLCLLPITASGTDLVTCEFTITDPAQSSQFVWRNTSTPLLAIVADDKFTACIANVLTGLDAPLNPLTISGIIKQDVLCFGAATGSATVSATGGQTPYSYLWSNGATTQSVSNLAVGTYSVTVSDASSSSVSASTTVNSPAALSTTFTQLNVSCAGLMNGSVNISASGGTSPYGISPSTTGLSAGNYTFVVTDANGCSTSINTTITQPATLGATLTKTNVSCNGGNNGSVSISTTGGTAPLTISPAQTGLSAGTYTFTITDANGCSTTVNTTITEPSPISLSSTQPSAICQNSTTDVTLSSTGVAPFSFGYCSGLNCTSFGNFQSSAVFNLGVGSYTFKATDANGCSAQTTVTINGLTLPTANAGADVTIAYGASTILTASGGISYIWSNGTAAASTTVSPVNRTIYSVTVTGANGCTAKDDVVVVVEKKFNISFVNSSVIGNKFRFTIRMSTTTPFCLGSNNLRFNFNKNALNNLTIVSDAFPHPAFSAVTTIGTSYTSGIASINTAYNDVASACMIPITTAGTDLVTCEFTITNPAQTSLFVWRSTSTPITAVLVDDKLTACTPDVLTGLNAPLTPMSITSMTKQDVLCFGLTTGSASVSVSGGLTPYTFLWSNGATTQSINNVVAGTYAVTVNDAFGYILSSSTTISSPAALTVALSQTNVSCSGRSDGSVNITVTGGTTPYQITPLTTGLTAGTYFYTITDANGCSTTASATITEPSLMTASPDATVNCFNPTTTISVTGGTSYLWSTGATTSGILVSPNTTTTYQVTATSGTCVEIKTIIVTADKVVVGATAGPDLTINCNNPSVNLNAGGGISYLWSNGLTTQSQHVSPLTTTTYSVTISGSNGCIATDEAVVFYDKTFPIADAGYDTYVDCNKTTALLKARNTINTDPLQIIDSYIWSNGANTANLSVSPTVTTNYTVTITGPNGCSATDNVQVQFQICSAVIRPKAYLSNFDLGTMTMDNYLSTLPDFPLTDPYASQFLSGQFSHVNNSLLGAISPDLLNVSGNNAVMDWVFLELRKDVSGFIVPVYTKAAIMQKDGDIVSTDGITPVNFSGAPSGSYYVAVRHRNHLGFRTLDPIALSATATNLNFTNNSVPLNGTDPVYFLNPTTATMCGGDANSDGSIDAFDTIIWEIQNGLFDDYNYGADYNMDGSVDAFDSIIWGTHNGKFQELE